MYLTRLSPLLLALFAWPCTAATLVVDSSSWNGDFDYFFFNWTHHSGQFLDLGPAGPIYFPTPVYNDNPGFRLQLDESPPVFFGLATNNQQLWDTSILGPVGSMAFRLQARIQTYIWPVPTGLSAQLGALVWNGTTNEFFVAPVNTLTTNWELPSRSLTPSEDFCRLQPDGSCTAVSGFGEGVLQFGYSLRVDLTNVANHGCPN